MRVTLTHVALTVLLIGVALPEAHAQFEKWPGFIKNYEIGYGFSRTWATYQRTARAVDGNGKEQSDTTKMDVSSKAGFSAQTGTSINLKRLGEKSQLALGITGLYNFYTWDYPTANGAVVTDTGIKYDYSGGQLFSGATLNAGLALSADFKFGAEAMMDKRYRLSWCGGIGVLPSINVTSDFDNASMTFGVQPFVKTEFGVRGPIVCKLRLLYAFANLKYIDVHNSKDFFKISSSENSTELTGHGNFTVSIILMPFSWTYKRSTWYNSF